VNVHTQPGRPRPECRTILGVSVAVLPWREALAHLAALIDKREFSKVGFLNAHNANTACIDEEFAKALEEFIVLPDGVGVDVASRLLYGAPFPDNLNGTDFVPALVAACERPLTIGLLGARRSNAEGAAATLQELAPRHRFVVVHDGYFTPDEERGVLLRIRELRPDILLVAMGVPRQELWIARNLTADHCSMAIAVGALLDFLSGAVPRAPRAVRRLRLEWLYRLYREPGRLWQRYVVGNPVFLARVVFQKLTSRGGRR
jgi:exopolysaccharide biosynthesis WecB/TagA/CpsF family protein